MSLTSRSRLILVDDEPVILELLSALFAEDGLDVVACRSGREALSALEVGCDVMLTDKNLPDVGGLELVRALRAREADAEAIILTGYASLDTALEAMELDVFDYIVKPPKDVFEVRRRVHQALAKQKILRENRRLVHELEQRNRALEASLAELRKTQSELVQSEKLAGIGTLAAGVAHEISSPLFGVLGLAEAISESQDLDEARSFAKEIVEYSRHIKGIVKDLTSYARTSEREYLTTVELRQVVADAVRLVGRSMPDMRVANQVDPALVVHARTGDLQQVFVNLVRNAVEATVGREDGEVRVESSVQPGRVEIRVADNGPGIPAEARSRVFDPFYTTKEVGKGTGLGLNIVYRILTRLRGGVALEETPGGGATFVVSLPEPDFSADDAQPTS